MYYPSFFPLHFHFLSICYLNPVHSQCLPIKCLFIHSPVLNIIVFDLSPPSNIMSVSPLFSLSVFSNDFYLWWQSHSALLLSELALPDIPAHVELHVLQAAQCVRKEHGGGHSAGFKLQVRLSSGEHHERVPPTPQLQPHTDRRPVGHQGLRHRHASGWVGQKWKSQRHKNKERERLQVGYKGLRETHVWF